MPRKAGASSETFPRLIADSDPWAEESRTLLGKGDSLVRADRDFLHQLQKQALEYFLDNQQPHGLMMDRQRNHGARKAHGLCSTSATGMGFIALALATAAPYHLLSRQAAIERIGRGLVGALEVLPHDHGIVPHFIDSSSGEVYGNDHLSTIDSSWLVAGGLWAAAFLQDSHLEHLAARLYDRVDWHYWTAPDLCDNRGLLRHGKHANGEFLECSWDRLNGETAFMYVLAGGANEGRQVTPTTWSALQPFYGTIAGLHFNNADLGLFVFQYSLDLLDLERWQMPGDVDLLKEAKTATAANLKACRAAASRFATYQRFWGLSAGDGPGETTDVYRCYTPAGPLDGTAHITATLASVAHGPDAILENLRKAEADQGLEARGRYGFSSLNVDQQWVGRDMIGIDAGAAVLALDNYLTDDRVRNVFQSLPCVQNAMSRLNFSRCGKANTPLQSTSMLGVRQAS